MRGLAWVGSVLLLAVAYVVVQLVRPLPPIAVRSALPATFTVPGAEGTLPWPAEGQAALAVQGVGQVGQAGATAPQPIASLAKMMVAYLTLQEHPLAPGAQGPTVVITPADVAEYRAELAGGQSVVAVQAGERLTERQLLEALLIPSGNNIADVLARWDAGSLAAFVARMNAEARRLGMASTHYSDASGVSPATVSTAADQVRLASVAMSIPAFRHTVAMAQVTLPVAGTVFNVNYFLGRGGIIGVKTGSTTAAGGCYVAAAYRPTAGGRALVIAGVLGQGGGQPLLAALQAGLGLVQAGGRMLRVVQPVRAGQAVATLVAPWAAPVPLRAPSAVSFIGWPGLRGSERVAVGGALHAVRQGAPVATLTVTLGEQRATLTLRAAQAIPPPSLLWRLRRI